MKHIVTEKEFIQRLKKINDVYPLVDFIGDYTLLDKDEQTNMWVGRCPLSRCLGDIIINPKKNTFVCGLCSASGDIIDFMCYMYDLKNIDALKALEVRPR